MNNIRGEIRLPETVAPFGVGAIANIDDNSVVFPDTSWWNEWDSEEVHCDRILKLLPPGKLMQAPINPNSHAEQTRKVLTAKRFPEFRFCEKCRALKSTTHHSRGEYTNACECGGFMQPMRFVVVCPQGSHMQEVHWNTWAHTDKDGHQRPNAASCDSTDSLRFLSEEDRGEGLGQLRVLCTACQSSRSLAGITSPDALVRLGIKCQGKQPWQSHSRASDCSSKPRVVLRGASGNYIQEVISALDIPEETPLSLAQRERIQAHAMFEFAAAADGRILEYFVSTIAGDLNIDEELVRSVIQSGGTQTRIPGSHDAIFDLKAAEWAAFSKKFNDLAEDDSPDFVVDTWETDSEPKFFSDLSTLISGIGQVHRLREVRTLIGYRRYHLDAKLQPVSYVDNKRIYPSMESFGEGIFIQFDLSKIEAWENQPSVSNRTEILTTQAGLERGLHVPAEQVEARFIALHTFAHLLIRKLSFQSGYAAASIRERIFATSSGDDPMAGVLIYTSSGDSLGTFGGLVRLGDPDLLSQVIVDALEEARICSNDPVCFEQHRATSSNLNLSSCHACSLIAEPSCETGNSILDRKLVIGSNGLGLFGDLMDSLTNEVVQANSLFR